jgi:small basic protein
MNNESSMCSNTSLTRSKCFSNNVGLKRCHVESGYISMLKIFQQICFYPCYLSHAIVRCLPCIILGTKGHMSQTTDESCFVILINFINVIVCICYVYNACLNLIEIFCTISFLHCPSYDITVLIHVALFFSTSFVKMVKAAILVGSTPIIAMVYSKETTHSKYYCKAFV